MIYKDITIEDRIEDPAIVWQVCLMLLDIGDPSDRKKEHLWGIGLDARKNVEYIELISLGTLERTAVSSREIFRLPVQKGIHSLILAHNHPSSSKAEPKPSQADERVTRKIAAGGELWEIPLRDHVLVSDEGFFSMANLRPELFEEARKGVQHLFHGKGLD